MRHPDLHITQIPAISVIYFGLLNSGYDFYHLERDEQHTASVHHLNGRDDLYKYVMNAGSILDDERDAALWFWLDQFPEALKQVMDSPHFVYYLQWERDWIAEQNMRLVR